MFVFFAAGGCATTTPVPVQPSNDPVGALLNVGIASAVGGVRVAEGDCFTLCGPGTSCNLKTKLCDALPCHAACGTREVCDRSGPVEHCVPDSAMAVSQSRPAPPEALPVGHAPPLSSAPPSSPTHPDVPSASP